MTDQAISPLRRRMIEDMEVRGFDAGTQRGYIAAVKNFTVFLGPLAGSGDDRGSAALPASDEDAGRFCDDDELCRLGVTVFSLVRPWAEGDAEVGMTTVRLPQRLPVILSPEEVARLLEHAPGLKARAALSLAYGAGLRASEVVSLKVSDIDSARQAIRVEQGKGRKDRYAMLADDLLAVLRDWWRLGHDKGVMLPGGWLFPGQNPVNPLTPPPVGPDFPRRQGCSRDRQKGFASTRSATALPPTCWSRRSTSG